MHAVRAMLPKSKHYALLCVKVVGLRCFYTARRYASAVIAVCLSVCLSICPSQVGVLSTRLVYGMQAFFSLSHTEYEKILVFPKIKVFPLGAFSETPEFRK